MTKPRHPWAAALLSLFVPGLGHLYDGHPAAAALGYFVGLAGLGIMLGAWLLVPMAPANIVLGLLGFPGLYLAVAIHAARLARRRGASYELRPYNRWYVYLAVYLLLGLLYPEFQQWLKRHVEAFRIPSGAMEPTLLIGDYLYVTKASVGGLGLIDGSIAVFESVEEPGLKVIKRIVGMPGDSVAMRSGSLWRNGERVSEEYVAHREPGRSEEPAQRAKMRAWQMAHRVDADTGLYAPDLQDWGPLVVPPDSFLALGDNRDASYDSRYYGFVPFTKVIGQPRVIYLSLGRVKGDTSSGGVRWSRIGQRVR